MCVGYKFALMEARMALARMMQRFKFETVPGIPPLKLKTSITYKPASLVLSIKKRQQA
jgi:thromboxane-A synthase/cytochrome P450 family 3 subfamily A